MAQAELDTGWQVSAHSGSPDVLNDLRAGRVTWSQLWEFYRQDAADLGSVLALMGFFHVFHSRKYEREGSVMDADGKVYPPLREWARFAVVEEVQIPEARLRDSLAGLLGLSLVSPLYYELAFSTYLEARLEREWETQAEDASLSEVCQHASVAPASGRMAVRFPTGAAQPLPEEIFSLLLARHYPGWDEAFRAALGDEADERFDDGGEG